MRRARWIVPFCLLLSACAAPPADQGALPMVLDFDGDPTGTYSERSLRADVTRVLWSSGFDSGRARIVGGQAAYSGHALQMVLPAQGYGTDAQGAHARIALPGSFEELYFGYRVRFAEGFDFVLGGKLPGLAGGKANTGGKRPDGRDGWSARMMWRKNGRAVQYVYHPDQPGIYGEDFDWQVRFVPGRWHTVEHRIVMNTPGHRDGVIETWFDGEPALAVHDLRFRDTPRFAIDSVFISAFFGGNGPEWAASRDETISFDDFIVSMTPIGRHDR
jgi:hypothetical protein